ncbi:hypothetical protein NUU61_006757 [Penicillium alfredii]|uniref:Pre-mRNA splicing factor CLF1 n=1 Tax=Penicillium alfredii TaxID=1506179 RepID=A0A9W9F1I9_9EURO|nr:uncharacterized protein NUU61_006757 [Penicillium alfredii]KAJ5091887.1 hypothetical protein NUU61_006757 [Penicillium alfredii]
MPVPEPPMKLEGHCSVIHDNTLYVFLPDHILWIPLKENGHWDKLPSEEKVSGAVCVKGGVDGKENEEALYVIGGTGASSDYSGLQRFSFKDKKWKTLPSSGHDMVNRTHHGAGYMASTHSILVYAGIKPGDKGPNSSTFLISTSAPYEIKSKPDQGAPPASDPMILSWSESEVALIGGSETNKDIYLFNGQDSKGWTSSGVVLPSPITSSVQCALAPDSGKSKVLESFKMDASPNTVSSLVLLGDDGKPKNPATPLQVLAREALKNTPHITTKRSDYSVAKGDNGIVVLSGGGGDDSLAIFNQTSNGWVNSTALFYGTGHHHSLKASTSSASSTPTATSSSSVTATNTSSSSPATAPASGGGPSHHTKTIIGATLGSVLGVAAILLVLLFLLRREKQKRKQVDEGNAGDGKDRLSFQDQGIEPLAEGAYPMAKSPVPVANASADSLAIMSGTAGEKSLKPPPASIGYGLSSTPQRSSPLSTIPSSGAMARSSVYSEDLERSSPGNQPGDRTTDEGWSKYFQGNNATNLAGDRSTLSSDYTRSDYRDSAWPMSNLAPLNTGFLDQPKPLGRVVSGSPTTEHAPSDRTGRGLVIPQSQSARISSADSLSLASEDEYPGDSKWNGAGQNSWLGRPTSSNYSTSFYNSSNRDLPAAASQYGLDKTRNSNGRKSSVVIPDHIDELSVRGQNNNVNTDMSWLNIHAER